MKYKSNRILCLCLILNLFVQSINAYCPNYNSTQVVQAKISKDIAQFPASYQNALKKLKDKHPNWTFEKVNINISWDTIIKNESAAGINTITSNVPNGGTSGTYSAPLSYLSTKEDAYDPYEDKYKVIDSTNRYTPNAQVIGYYMDPRNFLTKEQIFQFESLKYDDSQTVQGVQQILNGTFMKGDYTYKVKTKVKKKTKKKTKTVTKTKKVTKNYAQTFYDAGKKYKVNMYFLAIRARQEVGASLNSSTSGTCKGYKGYYNFYNIGASDSGDGSAVIKGLRYAKKKGEYGRPWNSQYKAILGGAEFIAKNYIGIGQNTFYFQKFSVVRKQYRYWHQYMSNIEAAKSEAKKMYNMYVSKGLLKQKITFRIPVYKNMPATAVSLPKSAGSSNNYIKTITVNTGTKKRSLVKRKNYKNTVFSITVANKVKKVKIKGKTCNKNAKITGFGTYTLAEGKTRTIYLTVTAQNGAVRKYQVKITRLESKKKQTKS